MIRMPSSLDRSTTIALGAIVVLALTALAAPVLPIRDPHEIDLVNRYASMSREHLFGTDSNGRDIFARIVWGTRTALVGPLVVTVVAVVVGVGLAVVAAWRGGWFDATIARLFDITLAFPGILLALLAAAVFGAGLTSATIALSIAYVPYLGRVTRAAAMQQIGLPYVEACRVQGHSAFRICALHVVPNLTRLVVAQASVTFGYALVDLAALSFLGLGVSQTVPDWGVMIASGQSDILGGHPQQALIAGTMVVLAVMAFTVTGDRIGQTRHDRRTRLL